MNKILNVTINILIVLWMLFCILLAIVIYSEIPSALNAPKYTYPFGMEGLGWHYYSLQNYVIWSGIVGTWLALGGIISILTLKYPRYRIYVLFHFITICIYLIWINSQYSY